MKVHFNQPYFAGEEIQNIINGALTGQISGDGVFTKKVHAFFRERYQVKKNLMTTSCSDALEMAALLSEVGPGDEVIVPSFTFMSTANAFVLRGAKIVFADVMEDVPNIDVDSLEELITENTRVIVVVHYAGMACDMDKVMALADKYNLFVVEDAAHAVESTYKGKQLGTIGHFGTFSFHETKNVICGEGGLLLINDDRFLNRSEIIWEKGTNRAAFHRGEVDKYQWVDVGSSFLPSDMLAAILYSQLSKIDLIQKLRLNVWMRYYDHLKPLEDKGLFKLPEIPSYASNNGHMFYLVTGTPEERDKLLGHLNTHGVQAVIHYLPLHSSKYYHDKHDGRELPNTDRFAGCLIRLPFFNVLKEDQIDYVVEKIRAFYS